MNAKEVIRSARRSYDAIAPLGGSALIGYWAGEVGMNLGSVGGFIGTLVGGELLKEVVRLKQEMRWGLKSGSRVTLPEMQFTESSRRRIL